MTWIWLVGLVAVLILIGAYQRRASRSIIWVDVSNAEIYTYTEIDRVVTVAQPPETLRMTIGGLMNVKLPLIGEEQLYFVSISHTTGGTFEITFFVAAEFERRYRVAVQQRSSFADTSKDV